MNNYDYDAPTQLLKVHEKNVVYADIVQTIPYRVYYPLCSMNVAFDRELIGPALMQGLMGVGQPWGRYDDMFSGWASKLVADHLRLGTKSGAPYIYHNKASNPFTNLAKEYKGLQWQEEVIRFFDATVLSEFSNTASLAYVELANKIELELAHLSPTFTRLAKAMKIWTGYWNQRVEGKLAMTPSRASNGPSLRNIVATELWMTLYSSMGAVAPTEMHHLPQCVGKLKVFVYDVPENFNLEQVQRFEKVHGDQLDCGYGRGGPCKETQSPPFRGSKMWSAEVPILAKLLLLPRTTDPNEADLFVVPWYGAIHNLYRHGGLPDSHIIEALPHFHGNNRKKHIFMITWDRWKTNATLITDAIQLTYGPKVKDSREIVVPPNGKFVVCLL